jgi:benzodiazapine receptor
MKSRDVLILLASIAVCFAAAALGSIATSSSIPTWYQTLNKPFFTPPNWLFGPVWTILYILMGIALFLVWRKGTKRDEVKIGIKLFAYSSYLIYYGHSCSLD